MADARTPDPDAPDDATTEIVVVERRRAWPWRVAKYGAAALLGLLAIVALALFGLNTGPGHRLVTDQIEKLTFENGLRISVGRIEGSIYGQMVLRNLSIRDPKGEFLFSPEVRVDWRPFAYARNHIDVRSATAQRMILRRLPEFKLTAPSDAPLLPDLDIDIDRLQVERFIAEPPVSGERRVATLDGAAHIASGRAQLRFSGRTIAGAGVAQGGDRVALVLDALPARNRLDLKLTLAAPKGGVLVAMAGLKQPLAVRLDGRGDWNAWQGKLDANLGGEELARLAVLATNGTFTIKGPTRLARLVTGPTASLLGPVTTIDLAAALAERRAKLTGTISSDAFTLASDGGIDLADNSFDRLKLAFVLLRPSALAPNLSGSGVRALLTLDGPFRTPGVDYTLTADRLVMNAMGLERLTASGAAKVDSEHIIVPVAARAARITGLDTVAGGSLANVRLNGDIAIDGPRILSDNMRLRSDRIDAGLILLADTSKGLYTGAVNGRIDNYRVESVGIFNIETNADLKAVPGGFAMTGKVRARSTRFTNQSVANFLGGNAVASSDVRYGPDGVIRFTNLRLAAPAVRVTNGSGSYSPGGQLALNASAVSRQYGPIGLRVAGTIADPRAHITATHPGLGIGIANLDAEIIGARGGYRLNAKGDTDYGRLVADVTLGTQGPLSLEINSGNLGGIDFAGRLRQTAAGPFAGQLTARGSGLGGVVRLAAAGRYQEALINLRATDTTLPGPARLTIGAAIVDARVVLYERPYVVADAQLASTTYGALTINAARVIVDYRDGAGKAKALVEGTSGLPFRIAVN
ncbi:MAG: hypothetical protein ABIT04_08030, partial [Novosphingobium sp.]